MTDTATPVAAWYPDPAGHAELRWWDGTRWTADVRSKAVIAPAAEAPAPVTPTPPPPTVSLTPEQDRAALYAAQREAHFAEAPQNQLTRSTVPAFGANDFGARPFGSPEVPDRFRATYEEKSYQAWRKNSAATSALTFAAINLGLLVWALFQHYSPYYRIVPSVIGITTALFALRQARETETGLVKALVALIVNGVIGAIAAFALLQLFLGFGNDFTFDSPEKYSSEIELALTEDMKELGHSTAYVVCPEKMFFEVAGSTYVCQEFHVDGTADQVSVEIQKNKDIVYWLS